MTRWLEYHEDPVLLHSGDKSHWLVRGDLIFSDKWLREAVLDYWEIKLKNFPAPFNFLGIPKGGSAWSEAIAERMGGHIWETIGCDPEGTYVIVDDVVTTGASLTASIQQLFVAI